MIIMRKILFFLLISFSLCAYQLIDKPAAQELLALFDVPKDLSIEELIAYLEGEWLQWDKERWEMDSRFEEKKAAALTLLQELDWIDPIQAKERHYDYALILGSTGKAMQAELDFLYEEWKRGVRFDQIVLLSGARDLDPSIETAPPGINTEAELLLYLFNQSLLKDIAPCTWINSAGFRPSRAKTISDWLLNDPIPGSCLVVSRQPFISYQEASVRKSLPSDFSLEAIGPAAVQEYPLSIYLDNFVRVLKYEKDLAN